MVPHLWSNASGYCWHSKRIDESVAIVMMFFKYRYEVDSYLFNIIFGAAILLRVPPEVEESCRLPVVGGSFPQLRFARYACRVGDFYHTETRYTPPIAQVQYKKCPKRQKNVQCLSQWFSVGVAVVNVDYPSVITTIYLLPSIFILEGPKLLAASTF